jgi:hypothetical protein
MTPRHYLESDKIYLFILLNMSNLNVKCTTVKPVHNGLCPQWKPVINGMESNLYTTETVYNERTISARTSFCPDEPVYNELSLNFFLFTSKKPSLGNSKRHF